MNENEKAIFEEIANISLSTTVLTSNILYHWPAEKIRRFALHLLGDKCEDRAAKEERGEETGALLSAFEIGYKYCEQGLNYQAAEIKFKQIAAQTGRN